ncbi:ankyrin repeat containing protein [Babesia caballi]|uniref:Ankyrin repeat containing protein n=1 Tax=Babesia caballi TaxID=5871 RepID=A0AAV4LU44_BABCB|nr:ankyrin repeat containing protein [Babesia caballi]
MLDGLVNLVARRAVAGEQNRSNTLRSHGPTSDRDSKAPRNTRRTEKGNGGRFEGDACDEAYLAKVEERVSSHLERILQDQASGRFRRIPQDEDQDPKVSSWEVFHRNQAHNRHVYFGGAPLGHSLELLKLKRREAHLVKEAEELVDELRKRDERIDELVKKQSVDFLKFEVALGKAMALGSGCRLMTEVIGRCTARLKRGFFAAMRQRQVSELRRSLDAQSEALKDKHKLAAMVIVRHVQAMLARLMMVVVRHWRHDATAAAAGSYGIVDAMAARKHLAASNDFVWEKCTKLKPREKPLPNRDDRLGCVETSLLLRLESLVAEEMQMLTVGNRTY